MFISLNKTRTTRIVEHSPSRDPLKCLLFTPLYSSIPRRWRAHRRVEIFPNPLTAKQQNSGDSNATSGHVPDGTPRDRTIRTNNFGILITLIKSCRFVCTPSGHGFDIRPCVCVYICIYGCPFLCERVLHAYFA